MSSLRILLLTILVGAASDAQDLQLEKGAVGSYLRLKELQSPASVLHVVAHPDDEDGAMLAYCARGLGVRTMLFSITRGEGGANLISSHFFDELGALRTLEHAKAASYYGNELFYSRAADYGYSKTLQEAMKQWQNGVPILEDLVEVIRRERPTVILSRFAGDPRDGHGHHQMAGVLSRLAFDAAADPSQFPEQIQRGLSTWQVKKFYVRAGSPWREPKAGEWTIALPTGTYDPVIGKSYSQVARFGLGFQRSQGISGHEGDPGPHFSYYRLLKRSGGGEVAGQEASLFDGIDTSWAGLVEVAETDLLRQTKSELAEIDLNLKQTYAEWNPLRRDVTTTALTKQLAAVRSLAILRDEHRRQCPEYLKQDAVRLDRKLQDAIITTAGLQADAWATDLEDSAVNHATVGERLRVNVRLANQSQELATQAMKILVESANGVTRVETVPHEIAAGELYEESVDLTVEDIAPTRPHWHRDSIANPLYQIESEGRQRPAPEPGFVVNFSLVLNDMPIELRVPVQTRIRHPEYGRVSYPLTVAPAMSVRFASWRGIVVRSRGDYTLPVVVRSCRKGKSTGTVRLRLPPGWSSTPAELELSFEREDETATVEFKLHIPDGADQKQYRIAAVVESGGREFRESFETVSARDVGRMPIYHAAVHDIQIADVLVAGSPSVGYIAGSGDKVAESLSALGITPTILSESDLSAGDLSKFDVILVGVRAYAVREDIRTHNARLLDFVRRGGTLIVQYQTPEFDQNFGPYPYEMGRRPEEVSEEDATIKILEQRHPILTTPNSITVKDFEGWFEQRGSKFWTKWDDHYTPLLECHDTGQAPQEGGMLVAKFGKGVYVYSAYAWYRQLPNGVPGAYRLFANMLSLPRSGLVE